MKKQILFVFAAALAVALTGCTGEAQVAARNLSQAADNFEIQRRVVFYNGINGEYMLTIEGQCSLDADNPKKVAITCKTGPSSFKKHYLGVSDNVTYFIEQLEPAQASVYHYRVTFKPSVIAPDVRMQ